VGRKINFSSSGIGVRGLRLMVGIPAHAPSAHALCVGATLRGQAHPAAPPGSGGKENQGWRNTFIQAARSCGQSVPKVQRRGRAAAAA
jgi:hypothetical protein